MAVDDGAWRARACRSVRRLDEARDGRADAVGADDQAGRRPGAGGPRGREHDGAGDAARPAAPQQRDQAVAMPHLRPRLRRRIHQHAVQHGAARRVERIHAVARPDRRRRSPPRHSGRSCVRTAACHLARSAAAGPSGAAAARRRASAHGWRSCPCRSRARSIASTRSPRRASSIAVAAPAQRAPTTSDVVALRVKHGPSPVGQAAHGGRLRRGGRACAQASSSASAPTPSRKLERAAPQEAQAEHVEARRRRDAAAGGGSRPSASSTGTCSQP